MFQITLKNGKSFTCDSNTTIFEAAKSKGILLEHSCLSARCRSCSVKVISGITQDKLDDLVLTTDEKSQGFVLSCNTIPKSDLELDVEDLGDIPFYNSKIVPAKIASLNFISDSVLKLNLRLPPNVNFKYNAGQYVNISKGNLKRSYSISNSYKENAELSFYIKYYIGGDMSQYWFNDAKVGDLLRIEGPKGSFFFRESYKKQIIFLSTGTGIAPVMALIDDLISTKRIYTIDKMWIFNGARYEQDLIWNSDKLNNFSNVEYIPVLSKPTISWKGEVGYVQDILLSKKINLSESQVYACGSDNMIRSALKVLVGNGLDSKSFFSDAFVATN
jgi:CDP-4-dehydro-6-deoxyglucose reductase